MKLNVLSLFKAVLLLIVGGIVGYLLSDTIIDTRRMLSQAASHDNAREAWEEFSDRINAVADRMLKSDFPNQTDRQRAEGIRQLAHVIVDGLRWEFDNASPEFTGLLVNNTDTSGWGGPNVDNKYLRGRIDGDSTYTLTGNIGQLYDLAIQTNKGDLHMGQVGASQTLDMSELVVDEQGNFIVTISPDPHSVNWIQQGPDHTILSIRAYYVDWDKHGSGRFHLVKDGNEGAAPPALSEKEAAQRLANAAHWIETNIIGWDKWLKLALINAEDNAATGPRTVGGGSSTMLYGGIPFSLQQDEALIIEVEDPLADYFSFQTYTYGWFDAGDYANHQTSLNSAQSQFDSDGKIRFVVSAEDPGVPNWIDTEERKTGVITYRYMRAKSPNQPKVTLVPYSQIHSFLLADTPNVTKNERKKAIAARQKHVQHRFHN